MKLQLSKEKEERLNELIAKVEGIQNKIEDLSVQFLEDYAFSLVDQKKYYHAIYICNRVEEANCSSSAPFKLKEILNQLIERAKEQGEKIPEVDYMKTFAQQISFGEKSVESFQTLIKQFEDADKEKEKVQNLLHKEFFLFLYDRKDVEGFETLIKKLSSYNCLSYFRFIKYGWLDDFKEEMGIA